MSTVLMGGVARVMAQISACKDVLSPPGLFMNTCYVVLPVGQRLWAACRSSRPPGLFSFGLLDGLHVRLRRPDLRKAPAGLGLKRLATAFMNNPG